jgi:hypothetical protein
VIWLVSSSIATAACLLLLAHTIGRGRRYRKANAEPTIIWWNTRLSRFKIIWLGAFIGDLAAAIVVVADIGGIAVYCLIAANIIRTMTIIYYYQVSIGLENRMCSSNA